MPTPGPERLGPDPRPLDQKFWDPEMQTMSRDERKALQDERFRDVVRKVFERPVPLFKRRHSPHAPRRIFRSLIAPRA